MATIEVDVPRLLTYDDVSKALGVTSRSVYQLVRDGKLPAVKVGSRVRFRPGDVTRYIESAVGNPDT